MNDLLWYLGFINLCSFIIYGMDKLLALKKCRRISERTLYLMAFFGGSLGAFIGMLLFRHKTKKIKFYLWNIFMLEIWIYLIYKYNIL